ncbi:unnamed protein product [Durusdinium trenchii]|uniref:Enoyl reductase (ER) domain-containing protein n=1 Tax=Durusdinium trenchii TaxID=1381693 RepID=A0ABP0LKB1_9DINO
MASEMMACMHVSGYGDQVEQLLTASQEPKPQVTKRGQLLVRVRAVALAPGDVRVMSGKTSLVQGPPSFPYVPGGDLSGVVCAVHESEKKFKVGDEVVCMFDTVGPRGALAEYKLVQATHAALKPSSISFEDASALPSSALSAMLLCEKYLRPNDRVLVLNGSGGVGVHLLQMLKPKASFVAATSTQRELVEAQGADQVVDYRSQNWWEVPEFLATPFDLVIDLWGTRPAWDHAVASPAVKAGREGGRYVTMVGDTPYMVRLHGLRLGWVDS